jgi:signal transduction histidine kinase
VVAIGGCRNIQEIPSTVVASLQPLLSIDAASLVLEEEDFTEGLSPAVGGSARGIQLSSGPTATAFAMEVFPDVALRGLLQAEGIRHLAIIPLADRAGSSRALLAFRRAAAPFSEPELEILRLAGASVRIVLENVSLERELLAQRDELRRLALANRNTKEEESRKIAHELHDSVGQLLAAVHATLDEALGELAPAEGSNLARIRTLLDQIEDQVRRMSHELRPVILDDLGVLPALRQLGRNLSALGVSVRVEGPIAGRMPPPVETALYRAAQEALSNAARHGKATQVWIRLEQISRETRCTISDDGVGFDLQGLRATRADGGLGLLGMREYLLAVGGKVEISSAPGQGTTLVVAIPLEP